MSCAHRHQLRHAATQARWVARTDTVVKLCAGRSEEDFFLVENPTFLSTTLIETLSLCDSKLLHLRSNWTLKKLTIFLLSKVHDRPSN